MPTVGRKAKKDQAHTQSVIFDKKKWDKKKCAKWLEQQGYKADALDENDESFRFRQFDPDEEAFRYKSKALGNGVTLVHAFPAEKTAAAKFAEEGLQYQWAHDEDSDTYTIKGVEIFAEGKWNGEPYDGADLEQMAEADAELHDLIRPRVKIGHGEAKDETSAPALGWIGKIRKAGSKLLADLSRLPKELFEAIQRGRYTRQSVEIRLNYKHPETGKRFPFVIDALAFLGAKLPAVQTLKPIAAFDEGEAGGIWLTRDEKPADDGGEGSPTHSFQQAEVEPTVPEAQGGEMDEKELKAKLDALAEKEAVLVKREAEIEATSDAVKERAKRLHASKVDGKWKELLEAGKVKPGEHDLFKLQASRLNDTEKMKFADGEMTDLEAMFADWDRRPVIGKKTDPSERSPEEEREEPDKVLFAAIEKRALELASQRGGEAHEYFAEAAGDVDGDHQKTAEAYRKKFSGQAPADVMKRVNVLGGED
jgi:hypothetical protein